MIKAYFRNSMAASGARHCPDFTTDFAGATDMAEPVAGQRASGDIYLQMV
jgi:hypothetical protein